MKTLSGRCLFTNLKVNKGNNVYRNSVDLFSKVKHVTSESSNEEAEGREDRCDQDHYSQRKTRPRKQHRVFTAEQIGSCNVPLT